MYDTARPTSVTSKVGSGCMLPSACGTPPAMRAVMGVEALPMSIWPQAMPYARPSRAIDLVRPVMACLVAVYGAEFGRGAWAEIEPLLMMRPPAGDCRFMRRIASCAHRNEPVRFTSTTACHWASVKLFERHRWRARCRRC